jgi:ABC-type lipoprotein release transport system permease subunit
MLRIDFFGKGEQSPSLSIKVMHTARAYIAKLEATTQHLQIRQWMKKHVVIAYALKIETNTHQLKSTGSLTESAYDETGAPG